MSKPIVVSGRTICDICKTDKRWTLSVDRARKGENINHIIKDTVTKQNEVVVDVNHIGHVDKLIKTTKVER